jgi:hypothetical protein
MEERKAWECIGGPLTEYECSDGDCPGEPAAAPRVDGTQVKSALSSHRQKQKERQSCKKRVARSKRRLNQGGDSDAGSGDEGKVMKGVTKRRRLESTADALMASFDLETYAEVTRPGWIGSSVQDLPQRGFTRAELEADCGLKYFNWDGL